MAKIQLSTKRLEIDKANATMVLIIGAAAFISVFCVVASKALLDQRSYQARVIDKKEKAVDQLEANIQAVNQLSAAYEEFSKAPQNVLGGSASGNGERDGDNSRIVLDALPSKYDFPALTTSLEKLVKRDQYTLDGISGTDDEVAQSKASEDTPRPKDIPISLESTIPQQTVKSFLELFEKSIRPIQVQKITLTSQSDDSQVKAKVTAKTYYQPAKNLNIKTERVK